MAEKDFVKLKNVTKIYQMGEVQIRAVDGIDFSIFNIVDHALEFRPFKVGSAPPIVTIVIDDLYAVLFAVLR